MEFGQIQHIQKLLRSREVSCRELTQSYLDAIGTENDTLNAYVTATPETALDAADRVDRRIAAGEELHPLEGVPMTLKDNICTKGIATTCCSKMLQNFVPIYNATVWELLQTQNAVLLGKTNMDEFAMGSSCETSCFGGARNPHERNHVAGGSSGGVAAAVGGHLAAYGLGSDTGGSIRQPASFCGLVGLKPTYGAVSRYGLVAFASSFDQIGPIASTVADAAQVFDAISQYDERDSTSRGRSGPPASASLEKSVKGVRIGVPKEYFQGVRPEVEQSLRAAIEVYRSLGAEIVDVDLPSLKYGLPVYYILACAEASSNLGRYDGIRYGYKTAHYRDLNEMICKTRSEGFGAEVKRRILLGTYVLSAGYYDAYYKKAQSLRGMLVKAFAEVFAKCDVILSPTVPMTAFPTLFSSKDAVETYQTDICTVPVNIAGLPAVSVPCGMDGDGLPIGMQLIGKRFCEAEILNAAHQYEQAAGPNVVKPVEMGVHI